MKSMSPSLTCPAPCLPVRDVEAVQGVSDVLAGEELLEAELGDAMEITPCLDQPGLKGG